MVSASIGGGRLGAGARVVRGSDAASGSQSSDKRREGPQATPERRSDIFEFRGNDLHLRYHGIEMVVALGSPEAGKRVRLSVGERRGEILLTIDQAPEGSKAPDAGAGLLGKPSRNLPYSYGGVRFSLKEIETGPAERCTLSINKDTRQLTITLRPVAAGRVNNSDGVTRRKGRFHDQPSSSNARSESGKEPQSDSVATHEQPSQTQALGVISEKEEGPGHALDDKGLGFEEPSALEQADTCDGRTDEEAREVGFEERSVGDTDDTTKWSPDQPSEYADAQGALQESETGDDPDELLTDSQSDEHDPEDAELIAWIYRGHRSQEEPTEPESCTNPEPQPQLEPEPQGAASEGADGVSDGKSSSAPSYETALTVPSRPSRSAGYEQASRNGISNIFSELLNKQHDEDFHPRADGRDLPTDAPPGSQEKIDVMRRRVEQGYNLWHKDDRVDYTGLTGSIRPRDDE